MVLKPIAERKVKSTFKKLFILALHYLLRSLNRQESGVSNRVLAPKRLLLLNPAHIGDVVISSSLLPVLKSAYPDVEIGFAVATWSRPSMVDHPLVNYTHTIDHWRMNRENLSFVRKIGAYIRTRRRALREIQELKYDAAICLHPGAIDLLNIAWQARIPVRVAFSKSFWAPLATALAEYRDNNLFSHQGECQADVLRKLGVDERHFVKRKSTLPPSKQDAIAEVRAIIGSGVPYVIVHMGSGAAFKEPAVEFWREVTELLTNEQLIVFTGRGARESNNVAQVISGLPNCINACGKLSWGGFVAAIRNAKTLYCVDSVAGHVAAAVGTDCVAVYHGSAGVARWRPEGDKSIVWTNHVSCAPCLLPRGCQHMTCMTAIRPFEILQIDPENREAEKVCIQSSHAF